MTDTELMSRAIKVSQNSLEPLRCGVIIALDGKIISEAFNSQRADCNATAHAEIKAIAEAGQKLGAKDLFGCTVYCTCEPCLMCLSALAFCKIKKLIFGTYLKDVSDSKIDIDLEFFRSKLSNKFEIIENYMEEECRKINQ